MRLTPRRGAQPSWPSAQKRAGGDTRPRGTELGWWWWVARGGAAMGLGWSRGCERCQLVVSCPWMAEQRRRGHWIALPGLAALQAATWPQFQPESASGTRPRGTESDCSTTAARRGMRARRRWAPARCGAAPMTSPTLRALPSSPPEPPPRYPWPPPCALVPRSHVADILPTPSPATPPSPPPQPPPLPPIRMPLTSTPLSISMPPPPQTLPAPPPALPRPWLPLLATSPPPLPYRPGIYYRPGPGLVNAHPGGLHCWLL